MKSCCPTKEDIFLLAPRPTWYVVADGAAIQRIPSLDINFASVNAPSGIVLSTREFNYDFKAAGHVLIGYTINECFQVEGVYMGIAEAENTASVRNTTPNVLGGQGNLFSPFGGFGANPIIGVDFNSLAQIRYRSSLQGAELNVRRQVPMPPGRLAVSVLFGVRYLDLPEDFQYLTQSDLPTLGAAVNSIQVTTQNRMIGPQGGALLEFYAENRWWVNVEGKVAVMNNQAQQSTTYQKIGSGGGTSVFFGGEREDHTAFVGDVALTFVYRWSPNFITRVGYQALFLQHVALAPSNLDNNLTAITQGPAELNYRGGIIYHGPFAGIEIAW